MIQSPINALPAGGQAVSAQPGLPPSGRGGDFGEWVESASAGAAEAGPMAEPLVAEPDSEAEAVDPAGAVDLPAMHPEQVLRLVGLPGAAGVPAGALVGAPGNDGTAAPPGDADSWPLPVSAPVAGPRPAAGEAGMPEAEAPPEIRSAAAGAIQPAATTGETERPAAIAPPAVPLATPLPAVAEAVPPAVAARAGHGPAPVSRQVADAVVRMRAEVTEITLAPAELGKLRITLSRDSHGLVVTLAAERPEALDLLRRHMDLLRQELAAQGEDDARLDFTAAGQGDGFAQPGRQDADPAIAALPRDEAARPASVKTVIRPVLPGRIDMRI